MTYHFDYVDDDFNALYRKERRTGEIFGAFAGLAVIIAWPIAHYAISKWLQGFAYRNGLSVWAFILAAAGALLVAFLTVSTQTFRTAAANPVTSLRYE